MTLPRRTPLVVLLLATSVAVTACGSSSESGENAPAYTLTATRDCLEDAGIDTVIVGSGSPSEARVLTANFPRTSVVVAFADSTEGVDAQAEQARTDGFSPDVNQNAVFWAAGPGQTDSLRTVEDCLS